MKKIKTGIVAGFITLVGAIMFCFRAKTLAATDSQHQLAAGNAAITGNTRAIANGRNLMSMMGVPDAADVGKVGTWSLPTSLVVNAQTYRVNVDDISCGEFKICTQKDAADPLVWGSVIMETSALNARRIPFAGFATYSSASMYSICRSIEVMPIGNTTNMLYVSYKRNRVGASSYLVHKNLLISMRGITNRFDFAVALLNAGLPENERVPLNGNGGTQNP